MKPKYFSSLNGNPRTICLNELESIVIVNNDNTIKRLKLNFKSGRELVYAASTNAEKEHIRKVYETIIGHLNVIKD